MCSILARLNGDEICVFIIVKWFFLRCGQQPLHSCTLAPQLLVRNFLLMSSSSFCMLSAICDFFLNFVA